MDSRCRVMFVETYLTLSFRPCLLYAILDRPKTRIAVML